MSARKRYQGTPEWLEERRGGIGASDVPILVQGSAEQWRDLFAVKLGILPDPPASETMEWGKRLEDVIAAAYTERTGHRVQRVERILRHRELDFVRASLDRRRPGAVVELKKWGFPTDDFGPDGSDKVPDAFAYQVQQQLAVTGLDVADIAVLFGGRELRIYTLGREAGTIDRILALEQRVWAYVQRGEIPPYPGPVPVTPRLAADEIELDAGLVDLALTAYEASQRVKDFEAAEKEAKDRLREALADVGGGRAANVSVSYRPQAERTTVAWQHVAEAYRKLLDSIREGRPDAGDIEASMDAIESLFTTTKPGNRPLLIRTSTSREVISAA